MPARTATPRAATTVLRLISSGCVSAIGDLRVIEVGRTSSSSMSGMYKDATWRCWLSLNGQNSGISYCSVTVTTLRLTSSTTSSGPVLRMPS